MPTHVVAAAAFEHLRHAAGKADLFAILRSGDDVVVPRARLASDVEHLLGRIHAMEEKGEIVMGPALKGASAGVVLEEALRAFAGYHATPVLAVRGPDLVLEDTRLLFYYQNRLAAHGLAFDGIAPKVSRVA